MLNKPQTRKAVIEISFMTHPMDAPRHYVLWLSVCLCVFVRRQMLAAVLVDFWLQMVHNDKEIMIIKLFVI